MGKQLLYFELLLEAVAACLGSKQEMAFLHLLALKAVHLFVLHSYKTMSPMLHFVSSLEPEICSCHFAVKTAHAILAAAAQTITTI
jgi:hypothetical protein